MICGDRGANPHSLALSFDPDSDGSVTAQCEIDARFQGYDGMLHGGMIGALLDAAMTHCLFARGVRAFTAEMTVRFVAPAPTNRSLMLTAHEVSWKLRMHNLEALPTLDDELLARATASFIECAARRAPLD
jgi:acyl-coenzyme A thioesterase PaaI-like protein